LLRIGVVLPPQPVPSRGQPRIFAVPALHPADRRDQLGRHDSTGHDLRDLLRRVDVGGSSDRWDVTDGDTAHVDAARPAADGALVGATDAVAFGVAVDEVVGVRRELPGFGRQ
jgi:hypothetical protein